MEESVSQLTDAAGEELSLQALGLTLNGERVAQHALVSGLLALEVLVTGSLPAAMLTQVCSAPGSFLHFEVQCCCPFLVPTPQAYVISDTLLAEACHTCHFMPYISSHCSHTLRWTVPSQSCVAGRCLVSIWGF